MSDVIKVLHTTSIEPQRSASDMMAILGRMGANNVSMAMKDNEVVGMSFEVVLGGKALRYRIPVKWEHIAKTMVAEWKGKRRQYISQQESTRKEAEITNQAKRTAWRLAHEWLRIQMAFVENKIKHPAEIFLPDMIVSDGESTTTVGERFLTHQLLPGLEYKP